MTAPQQVEQLEEETWGQVAYVTWQLSSRYHNY